RPPFVLLAKPLRDGVPKGRSSLTSVGIVHANKLSSLWNGRQRARSGAGSEGTKAEPQGPSVLKPEPTCPFFIHVTRTMRPRSRLQPADEEIKTQIQKPTFLLLQVTAFVDL